MVAFTLSSANAKTGPIPVSMSSGDTCPDACPLKRGGCYAMYGNLAIHWNRLTQGLKGITFKEFCQKIKALPRNQLWRHNQAGDLEGKNNSICAASLRMLVKANSGKKGFAYTHKPVLGNASVNVRNSKLIAEANANGFTINLSANNLQEADKLKDLGIAPVVVILPEGSNVNMFTPNMRKVVICPAITRGVTCSTCGLCQKQRDCIIGFPAHGVKKKLVSELAAG